MKRLSLLILPFLAALSTAAGAQQTYTIQDVGTMSATPSDDVLAKGINNRGHVMGQNKKTSPSGLGEQQRSFLWDGAVQNEIFPSVVGSTWAGGLNDLDQCVGQDTVAAARWLGFFWQGGVIRSDIDLGPHHWTFVRKINSHGFHGGDFYSDETYGVVYQYHAFLRARNGAWLDLGSLADNRSFFRAMNDLEEVVGISGGISGPSVGFFWTLGGGMVDIGTLGGGSCNPQAIDNLHRIAGQSQDLQGRWRPFLFENSVMSDMGTLGGDVGLVSGMNDFGVLVGNSEDGGSVQHATIWRNGAVADLNSLIPPGSGWDLTGAKDVNELGEICGTGWLNGLRRTYKLTPVLAQPRISGFQPGLAGEENTVFGLGFTPGAVVEIHYGLAPGNTTLPCGAVLDIQNARLLLTTTADADGRIEISRWLPGIAAGRQPLLQAVEPGSCLVGELREQLIQ